MRVKAIQNKTQAIRRLKRITLLIGAISISGASYADDSDLVQIIKPETKSQLWINPGMVSYHFQRDKNFNNGNWGAGLEYRLTLLHH